MFNKGYTNIWRISYAGEIIFHFFCPVYMTISLKAKLNKFDDQTDIRNLTNGG